MKFDNKEAIIAVLKNDMDIRLWITIVAVFLCVVLMFFGINIVPIRLVIITVMVITCYILMQAIIKFDIVNISWKYIFNVMDLLMITYAIDSTGGYKSPLFLMLFTMPLAEATMHDDKKLVIFTWVLPCIGYPLYIFIFNIKNITAEDIGIVIVRTMFLVMMGAISYYYQKLISNEKEKVMKANEEIKKTNQSLEKLVEKRTQELKNTQYQLIQSAKMAAIGQLASGAAHELNNPMTVILGHAQILLRGINDKGIRTSLQQIEEQTYRCKKIIKHLLGFARQQTLQTQQLNINDVITKAIELASLQLRMKDIEIISKLDNNVLMVKGDSSLLEQVIQQLLVNAYQAITGEGKIIITTCKDKDGTVKIEVEDNGAGIDGTDVLKVFDPFFTTKEIGSGTGLGLFVAYSIIEKHGGKIRAESEGKGKGARLIINLPETSEQ
jgi:signal transduction histidine kinase